VIEYPSSFARLRMSSVERMRPSSLLPRPPGGIEPQSGSMAGVRGGRLADILRANSTTPLTLDLSPVKNGGEENFFSLARPCGDAVVRCRSAGTVIVSWKTIGKLDPRQLFRTVGVKLRRKVLRLLEAGGVEVNLVGVLVVFESHWRSAIGAKQPARARRGPVHLRCLASEAIRVLRHAEPCCEW
jgi:hypothetical protein